MVPRAKPAQRRERPPPKAGQQDQEDGKMNPDNSRRRLIRALLLFLVSSTGVAAAQDARPDIYFIRGVGDPRQPAFALGRTTGAGQAKDIAPLRKPGEFLHCGADEITYVDADGEVSRIGVKSGARQLAGKTAFRPRHELRNKFLYEPGAAFFVAAINRADKDARRKLVRSFTLERYHFDGRRDVLFSGPGSVTAMQGRDREKAIRLYLAASYVDIPADGGPARGGGKVAKAALEGLSLLGPDFAIQADGLDSMQLRKGVDGAVLRQFALPGRFPVFLDYHAASRSVLFVSLAGPENRGARDALSEYDFASAKITERGAGAPIVDGCYAR
jgi:hypothetical protein